MSNILNGSVQSNGLGYVKANIDGINFNNIQTKTKFAASPKPIAPQKNINDLWIINNNSLNGWVGINAVDINWNGAEIAENTIINTTGELLSWIKNNNSGLNVDDVQTIVNNRVEQIIGEAPEALDTLKEIADKLGDDDNAISALTTQISEKANSEDVYTKDEVDNIVNGLSEIVETQTQQIETLQSDNAALLERIKRLEKAFSSLVPAEPEDESYNVIVPTSDEPLTLEEIIASINPEAEKPEVVQALNMNQLSNPTDTYLVYPLSWEIVEDDQIVSPIIKDWNGFEIGFSINEDTPTVMVDEVEYRVSDIKLGKGQYTIEFK